MKRIVWLASYPKSGNTWFRAFLENLRQDARAPVSINQLNTGGIASGRAPLDGLLGYDSADLLDTEMEILRSELYVKRAAEEGPSLFLKVHDAYTYLKNGKPLFPPEATFGVLYFIRNPLDVCVSLASHQGHTNYDKVIKSLGNSRGKMNVQPRRYQEQLRQIMLSWSRHSSTWIDTSNHRVHVMRYEDMVMKPEETFTAAARFANLPDDPARINKALKFSSFEELSRQEEIKGFRERSHADQKFFRKGKIGSWRETLTAEQAQKIISDHSEAMKRFGYMTPEGELRC